jgi:hypothetical protein
MQTRPATSVIAAIAAIGLNLSPGLARAEFDAAMTAPGPASSRVLAAEITAFRDGASSVRPLPDEINARVDEAYLSSGAWRADLSAHSGRIGAARSEGVILSMTEPAELVSARLNGMLVAYEVIDARVRLNPGANPEPVPARSLPSPDTLRILVDERLGLPAGEAALAGYERMMGSWSDLGPSPAPAPIRTPEQEAHIRDLIRDVPEMSRFAPSDLLIKTSEERAERVRAVVAENPGLERFVHSSILTGSDLTRERVSGTLRDLDPERLERLIALVEENPRARRFITPSHLEQIETAVNDRSTTPLSPERLARLSDLVGAEPRARRFMTPSHLDQIDAARDPSP